MKSSELEIIAAQIRTQNVIAFLGAGVSATYTDTQTGKKYLGLPTGRELVTKLSQTRDYIKPDMAFEDACFLIKRKESKTQLIKFLNDNLANEKINPLPAHKLLAAFPIPAFISMNFDTLLEKAMSEIKKECQVAIRDQDVPLIKQSVVSIIKPHGCISRTDTIVASSDDIKPFMQNTPILDAYLKTILAHKTVLFLGFSMKDQDFRLLFQQLKSALGEMMPSSYAIANSYSEFDNLFWETQNVKIINADLTSFLRSLSLLFNNEGNIDLGNIDDETLSSQYFGNIINLKYLPSEIQITDAFIDKLLIEIQDGSIEKTMLISSLKTVGSIILKKRSTFQELGKTIEYLVHLIENSEEGEIETVLQEIKNDRVELSNKFKKKGKDLIKSGDNILIFSQSSRVTEVLLGVPKSIQDNCKIYICECRTKSLGFSPFNDALSSLEKLKKTHYEIALVPDLVAGHLISKKLINKAFLGANTIFVDDENKIQAILNTSGSLVISDLCEKYGIPIYLIAEKSKCKPEALIKTDSIQNSFEFKRIKSDNPILLELIDESQKIGVYSVNYDLVPKNGNMEYINEY